MNGRCLKLWTTRHSLVCNVIYYTTSITDNDRLFISRRCHNWSNLYIIHPNIMKRQCHIIVGVLSSLRLLYLILIWYWITMNACNNWTLGVIWRWRIWFQDERGMSVFKKFSDECNSIWLVDRMIAVSWKEYSEQILFVRQKETDSGTVNKEINMAFNQNIWIDGGLGEINIFLNDNIPRIELCKIFIWADGNSGYLRNQNFI